MTTEERTYDNYSNTDQNRNKDKEHSPWITLVVLVFISKIMAGGFLSTLFGGIAVYYFFVNIWPDLQEKYFKKEQGRNLGTPRSNQQDDNFFEEDSLSPRDYFDLEQNLGPDSLDELIEEKHKTHNYRY